MQQWIQFNVKKAVVRILQGSVVTQTILGGLTTYSRVANFLQCIRAKNYENWLAVDKVIAKIIRLTFLAHPVCKNSTNLSWICVISTEICVNWLVMFIHFLWQESYYKYALRCRLLNYASDPLESGHSATSVFHLLVTHSKVLALIASSLATLYFITTLYVIYVLVV